jgi:hypothetical protein
MSNIKPITINPELFKVGGGTKKEKHSHNKTQKISTIKNNIRPNKLKRDLLQKIKNYKQKEKNSSENVERKSIQNNSNDESNTEKKGIYKNLDTRENNEFQNEFMKSLNFLQQLSQKGRNKTMKANRPLINIDMPDNLKEKDDVESKLTITNKENGDVPYGCLKNGSKPTFRQWKNYTVKNTSYKEPPLVNLPVKSETINNVQDNQSNIIEKTSNNVENNELSNELSNEIKREVSQVINNSIHENENQNTYSNPYPNNSYISTKTKTIKYHLGKKNRKISILIKNAATRKKINAEHNKIKRTSVLEMKNYLRKHNLLKAGSEAPNDVIRKLYEQCLLSGNINNTNKDNLLHNYLNDEK